MKLKRFLITVYLDIAEFEDWTNNVYYPRITYLKTKGWFVGWFYNGLMQTPFRTWGLKDLQDRPVEFLTNKMAKINL